MSDVESVVTFVIHTWKDSIPDDKLKTVAMKKGVSLSLFILGFYLLATVKNVLKVSHKSVRF